MEGNLRFKIDRASHIVYLEGLIHGGAYFRNFTVCTPTPPPTPG